MRSKWVIAALPRSVMVLAAHVPATELGEAASEQLILTK
jgi:hypothetical protein